jgi:hypothetical protein
MAGLLVAAVPAASAAAGTTARVRDAGIPGLYYLIDNASHAGANCVYSSTAPDSSLRRILVRPPHVFALDRRDGRIDRQWVGWRVVVLRSPDGFHSRPLMRTRVVRAVATDHAPAPFTARRIRPRVSDYYMSIQIRMYWYRAGRVVATARINPRYFRFRPHEQVFRGGCRL